MSRASRVRRLEVKNITEEFVLYMHLRDNEYIRQTKDGNEYLTKEEYELQTKDMEKVEFV